MIGTLGNDVFYAATGDKMNGGLGDDYYYVWNNSYSIDERANGGIDTLTSFAYGTTTLAANVENLFLSGAMASGAIGNALDNIIVAGDINSYLDGGAGNDVLVGGAYRDTFIIHGGNGSDAIENFTPGADLVSLDDYGITSFAQLLAFATQDGDAVRFALPNGESLVLRDTDLSALSATDFRLENNHVTSPAIALPADPTATVMNGAGNCYTENGWYVFNNAWGAGSLVENRDYTIGVSYHVGNPSEGTIFDWSFPTLATAANVASTVKAYPELAYGPSPLAGGHQSSDIGTTLPVQLSTLTGLDAKVDIALGGDISGYNVSFDLWFTSVPNGDSTTVTNEIMVWLHQGDFEPYGSRIATYSDGDFAAQVYHAEGTDYTAVVANSDYTSGTIDLEKLFDSLKSLGILHDDEYLASVQLGAEVASGTGSLAVRDLELDVSAAGVNGTSVTTHVSGTGETVTAMHGTDGADLLNDAEAPMLIGLGGDDIYLVTSRSTIVQEASDGGTDLVRTTLASYVLPDNIENLTFVGMGDATLTGNALDNSIAGGAGNDMLTGGGGHDTLIGGAGNDTYLVDNASVSVIEAAGGGTDTVHTTLASYALPDNVENLTFLGTGDATLTGNALDNGIAGGAGNDTIDGGLGNDVMDGGSGLDTASYASANAAVTVSLALQGQGQDTIGAGVDTLTNFENLTGSAYNDALTGDGNANVINAGAGNDIINGGSGNDTINAGPGVDTISGGPGIDTINGNGGADIINGNGGADIIAGGAGADTLTGGAGNDTFVYGLVTDSPLTGPDLITDFVHGQDKIDLSGLLLVSANDVKIGSSGGMTFFTIDTNHDGTADMQINLTGANVLTLGDIIGLPANAAAAHASIAEATTPTTIPHDLVAAAHSASLDHALFG